MSRFRLNACSNKLSKGFKVFKSPINSERRNILRINSIAMGGNHLGVRSYSREPQIASLKSYRSVDPLVKYTTEHSLRLTDVQKKLNEKTLTMPNGTMLAAPEVHQLNQNLIRAIGAKRALDIGVFTGASTLSAALGLPENGEIHSLDTSKEYTDIGKPYWKEAGVSHKVHLHIAPASETLQKFIDEGQEGTFDFAFIDADKEGYDKYYEQCLILIRSGGIISFDNTLQNGRVIDPQVNRSGTVAMRKLNEKLRDDNRINISFLKFGDGLTLCFKK